MAMAFGSAPPEDGAGKIGTDRGIDAMQSQPTLEPPPAWLPMPPGLLLYVVVPLVLFALPLAFFRVTVGPQTSLVLALYFWSATVMIGWLAGALGSEILFRLCARQRPSLWVITLLGPLLTGFVLREPIVEILSFPKLLHSDTAFPVAATPMTFSWVFLQKFLVNLAPGTIVWMATNYVFDHMLGIPRYRYPARQEPHIAPVTNVVPATVSPSSAPAKGDVDLPPLIVRLPRAERGELIALKADDHYVRIYTDAGEALTLSRLCDAIKLTQPTRGMQVHRSSWVADRSVRAFRRTRHTGILYLSNGLEIPVSRSYCRQVEKWVKALEGPHVENAQEFGSP